MKTIRNLWWKLEAVWFVLSVIAHDMTHHTDDDEG